MNEIITRQDIIDLRSSHGIERTNILEKIRQRGFKNTLKDLQFPSDLNTEWRSIHMGTEALLKDILNKYTHRSIDEEIPYILEHWEPNIGINPIKEAVEKITKDEVYQKVVNRFSYYKGWKEHGHTFDSIHKSIRSGMEGGSFIHGGSISVGGYLNNKNIGTDKILVEWNCGKYFIFTLRQVLEDVLGENKNRQLSFF